MISRHILNLFCDDKLFCSYTIELMISRKYKLAVMDAREMASTVIMRFVNLLKISLSKTCSLIDIELKKVPTNKSDHKSINLCIAVFGPLVVYSTKSVHS